MQKKLLVLYKQREPDHQGILNIFTEFLKQGQWQYDTYDIEQILAGDITTDMSQYSGIMTTYQTSSMVGGHEYPKWLVQQMEAGRKVLIIGSYGAYQSLLKKDDGSYLQWNESTDVINTFFYPFGLEFFFAFTNDNTSLKLVHADDNYAQFEDTLTQKDLNYYQLFKSVNPKNKIFFELERTDMKHSNSALNVITPYGGMILEGYSYYWDAGKNKNVYRVNYPAFIQQVFGSKPPEVEKILLQTHEQLLAKNPLPERKRPESNRLTEASDLKRKILLLYKQSESPIPEKSLVYNRVGVVLEYLGLIPDYHAVEDGLPDRIAMQQYYGVVTYHTKEDMINAEEYGKWMEQQIAENRKVVILNAYGATIDSVSQKRTKSKKKVFNALGIEYIEREPRREEYVPEIRVYDKELLGFEHPLLIKKVTYQDTYRAASNDGQVFFSLSDKDYGEVDLGIITDKGGFVHGNIPFYFPAHDLARIDKVTRALNNRLAPEIAEKPTIGNWIIEPYKFFTKALQLEDFPAPDITTINGSRIFYAHIDGDGLESVSEIDKAHSAGHFIYENLLKKYQDIPTTVSVITLLIEKKGNEYYRPSVLLARDIYNLPNIDVATHTATHPFDWIHGDPFVSNPESYPFNLKNKQHKLVAEIWGSKLFIDHNLIPSDKQTESVFWSGATNPNEKALEVAWRSGLHNLNGGDPRFDNQYPSLAGLVPYSLPYYPYRQYMTSAQNDYYYTLFLTGDWGGQRELIEHFENTETPHRIYPMNLYYHFYSGIKQVSVDALNIIYDYVRSHNFSNVFATDYLKIVEDNYRTIISRKDDGFIIKNNGELRTIRFNQHKKVDMARSKGVIGFFHTDNKKTYVHLDAGRQAEIYFSDHKPEIPYIIQATQYIDEFESRKSSANFILTGFGKVFLRVGGLDANQQYNLILHSTGDEKRKFSLQSDSNGELVLETKLPAPVTTYSAFFQKK